MAEVYSAADPELGRKVAIKFLSPRTATQPAVEQLIGEAKAASALNHPNIITVYEVIRAGDDVAIAMELVEGRALRGFCGRPAETARVIDWGRQIAQALFISEKTASVHVTNLLRKLGVTSRIDAAAIAQRAGLTDG